MLEWNVLYEDFNDKSKVKTINILKNWDKIILDAKKENKFTDFNSFKEWLNKEFLYRYWSKREYEIAISGLSCNDWQKIDVYFQLKMNFDRIVEYINKELKIIKEVNHE